MSRRYDYVYDMTMTMTTTTGDFTLQVDYFALNARKPEIMHASEVGKALLPSPSSYLRCQQMLFASIS
eukprot:1136345-Pelagomonas_calceolata.AAC.3